MYRLIGVSECLMAFLLSQHFSSIFTKALELVEFSGGIKHWIIIRVASMRHFTDTGILITDSNKNVKAGKT